MSAHLKQPNVEMRLKRMLKTVRSILIIDILILDGFCLLWLFHTKQVKITIY